jgi:type II secretory pathway pseudopilin PulG
MVATSAGIAIRTVMGGIALLAPSFIGAGARAQEIKLTRSAASGIESLLVDERSWDASCKPLATAVTITNQPSNGTVSVVPGVSIIAASTPQSGGMGRCAGKSVTGNHIMYRSNPGFRGTDTLAYKVLYANGKSGSMTVTINVH